MKYETNSKSDNPIVSSLFYHFLACVATPAGLLGTVMLGSRKGMVLSFWILENKSLFYLIIAIAVIIVNSILFFKNFRKNVIVSILFNDAEQKLTFETRNLYSSKIELKSLSYQNFYWKEKIQKQIVLSDLQDEAILIYDGNKYFAKFSLKGVYWNNEGVKIKRIKELLEKIKPRI